jgi:hypothetical protein
MMVGYNCTGDQPTTSGKTMEKEYPQPVTPSSNYYPLHDGNQWRYRQLEMGYRTKSVTGQDTIDGNKYFVISNLDSIPFTLLLREENGVVYRRIEGLDAVMLDFTRPIGEKWQVIPYEQYAFIASRSETISSSKGPIANCIKIVSESELINMEYLYAPGIGKISSSMEFKRGAVIGGHMSLVFAIINGDTTFFPN